ncbi:hypothetical protein [Cohnella yongneupensis]|uniref:Heparinase II/III-like protein n=1 Tax=Cohnella yongneupensis TaxID=425006 RepID=A0ABW0R060_9BACL
MLQVATLRSVFRGTHPLTDRVYYPAGESADAFWQRVSQSSSHARLVNEIRAEAARLLAEPATALTEELFGIFARTGSRLEYERAYFERRRRLNTFAIMTLLEPDDARYRESLHETIGLVLSEPTWCLPAHVRGEDRAKVIDLFSAETGFTLCEIACVLGDKLPESLAREIGGAVEARLIALFESGGTAFSWETATNNWSAVCAGSIGAAALLSMRDTERLSSLLNRVSACLDYYLAGFGDDGACPEGLGYWNYGFGYYVYFADLLKHATGGDVDLFDHPKVRSIALFQQAAYLHGDAVAGFSDSLPRIPFRVGLTHYLANVYPEVEAPEMQYAAAYTDDHCSRWAPAFRDLLWLNSDDASGVEWGTASRYLPDAEWLLSRHVTSAGRRFGFAAKGGHNDEPHNHNDLGHFILIGDGGEAVACDLGCGEYTADYFGAKRYGYDCNGSHGHSVPIIDGRGHSQGAERKATVLEAMASEQEDILRLELAAAYEVAGLRSFVRELRWKKSDEPSFTLTDVFSFDNEPQEILERIVTRVQPLIADEGGIVRLGKGGSAVLRFDATELAVSIDTRSFRDHFGNDQRWYAIDLRLLAPQRDNRISLTIAWENGA